MLAGLYLILTESLAESRSTSGMLKDIYVARYHYHHNYHHHHHHHYLHKVYVICNGFNGYICRFDIIIYPKIIIIIIVIIILKVLYITTISHLVWTYSAHHGFIMIVKVLLTNINILLILISILILITMKLVPKLNLMDPMEMHQRYIHSEWIPLGRYQVSSILSS